MKKRKILTYDTLNSSINYDLGDKKLSLNHNDVKMNKSFIPISVSHIFQNNNYESKYGKGFKLNIEQKLYSDNGCYVIENPNGYKEKFNEIIYYLDNNGKRVYTRENGKKLTRDCIVINNGVLEYNGNTIYIETKTDSGLVLLNNYEGFSNSKDLELRNEDIASLEEEIRQIEDTLVDIKYNLNEYTKYSNTNYINMLEAQKDYDASSQNLRQIVLDSFDEVLVEEYQDKKQEYLDTIAISQNNVGGLSFDGENISYDSDMTRYTYSNNEGKNAEKYNVKLSYEGDTQVFENDIYSGAKVKNVNKFKNMSADEKYFRYYNQVFNDRINKLNYELQQKSTNLENANYSYQKESYDLQLVNLDKENEYLSAKKLYEDEYIASLKEYYNALIERSKYQIEYYNKILNVKKYQLQMMYQQYPELFVTNQEGLTYGYNKYGYLCMIFDSFEHQLLIEAEYD
ncbi:MAG: hypothetical protein IJA65_04410, partial [Acholeplasmatales bacterium]|nr:hypothetical protein [Acholeplasmatales bacterium]